MAGEAEAHEHASLLPGEELATGEGPSLTKPSSPMGPDMGVVLSQGSAFCLNYTRCKL